MTSKDLSYAGAPSLDAYIYQIQQAPMLTEAEEYELANRLQSEGDREAAKQLVFSHLRLVVKIARGYLGYGLSFGDLIQEGNVGLMKAVKRFDPSVGVRLSGFAVHWIRAEIHEFVIRNWRIVKIATTKAQRKLFFNLRQAKHRLGWMNCEEIDTIAKELGVTRKDVEHMEARLAAQDVSFDTAPDEDDDSHILPTNTLGDTRYDPARLVERDNTTEDKETRLRHALNQLDDRTRQILEARWLQEPKMTLQELALKLQVSAERIRQIEAKAFKKLGAVLKK